MFVGKTKHQLHITFGEHIKNIRQDEETPVAQHFAKFYGGQSDTQRIKGFFALNLISQKCDFNTVLFRKEKYWIFKLGTLSPKGLNNEMSLKVFLKP